MYRMFRTSLAISLSYATICLTGAFTPRAAAQQETWRPLGVRCGIVYSMHARPSYGAWTATIQEQMGSPLWSHMLFLGFSPFIILENRTDEPLTLDGGSPERSAAVEFQQPPLKIRFKRAAGFATREAVPLSQTSFYLSSSTEPKRFRVHLHAGFSEGTPDGEFTLAAGETRIFSPALHGALFGDVHEWISDRTNAIPMIPGPVQASFGYYTNFLTGSAPLNTAVNGSLRVIPSRINDVWDIELTRGFPSGGSRVFLHAGPPTIVWPGEQDTEITDFPFSLSDAGGPVTAYTMAVSNHDTPVQDWPVHPIFSALVPATSIELYDNDTDGNLLDDAWENYYFHSTGADPYDDEDGDSLNNLFEFRAGTSPVDDSDRLVLRVERNSPDEARLEWNSVPGHTYIIEMSQDLSSWTEWTTVFAETGSCVISVESAEEHSGFFRIRLPAPP